VKCRAYLGVPSLSSTRPCSGGQSSRGDAMNLPSESPSDPAARRRVVRAWERPETEFGVLVPVGILQFDRTEPSAVAVTALWAYSNGFEFMLTRLLRPDGPSLHRAPMPSLRKGGPGMRQPMTFGLGFADGSQVLGNVPSPAGDEEPPSRILDFLGGFGSTHRGDERLWTWPLPPSGRLDFICRLGAVETRVSVDAQLILDAAQRSVQVWPDA
jgi:hypothetical protein